MFKIREIATGKITALNTEQEVADLMQLDISDVLWAVEEFDDLATDTHELVDVEYS